MNWTELVVTVARGDGESAAAAALSVADGGIYIEDYTDLEEQVQAIAHVDLIEDELLAQRRDIVRVHLYLGPDENPAAISEVLRGRLQQAGVAHTLAAQGLRQEDWENSWKQFYHAFDVGARLAVAPSWEAHDSARTLLRLDPGMAFGTGTHETTALCLEVLDEAVQGGERVLDIGTGSGILAVAALLLGAESATGIDIDPMAVRTARENAALNGVEARFTGRPGDLAAGTEGRYDIITANIVADAIIRLAPDIPARLASGGVFVASGVIDAREAEVSAALVAAGLPAPQLRRKGGWLAFVCKSE